MGDYDGNFPLIKFSILTILGIALIFMLTKGIETLWLRIIFILGVPLGVGLALMGKTSKGFTPLSKF